jgi:hypothetical protein
MLVESSASLIEERTKNVSIEEELRVKNELLTETSFQLK